MAQDFKTYADLAMRDPDVSGLRPVIEKEILHYEILKVMSEVGALNSLVFQGGTALRLCHGGVRYSEDLDFSGGPAFSRADISSLVETIRERISEKTGLPVEIREPKEAKDIGGDPVKVATWSIRIQTEPERRNLPSQKIKVDIDTSTSFQVESAQLLMNYDFLPKSFGDFILPVQSAAEIMSNKALALPVSIVSRGRARNRDIWDLRWLGQRRISPDIGILKAKASEHAVADIQGTIEEALDRLTDIIEGQDFIGEMRRFLPVSVFEKTIRNPDYRKILSRSTEDFFRQILNGLEAKPCDGFEY